MATVILARHGRSTANAQGILAGRSPGVDLDEVGRDQASHAGARLAGVPLALAVTSPIARCRQTLTGLLAEHPDPPATQLEHGLTECDYGDWQGERISTLSRRALWRTVQEHPSAAWFPGGESLAQMQARAVAAVRRLDTEVADRDGAEAVWLAVSHGDVIKSVLADALGLHLDLFQRLHVGPSSLSVVRYTPHRPQVLATNSVAGDLSWLRPPRRGARGSRRRGDAVVGGGAGPA